MLGRVDRRLETGSESVSDAVPCFTPDTLIATPGGLRRACELRLGDKVITRDNGFQEIRWLGQRVLSGAELGLIASLRPIRIRAGAMGEGFPSKDLYVSPQHRLLLKRPSGVETQGAGEVLVAAADLIGREGVEAVASAGVTYVHFMCDVHELVLSDGVWTESFQPRQAVIDGLGAAQRDEILRLFPALGSAAGVESYAAVRPVVSPEELTALAG